MRSMIVVVCLLALAGCMYPLGINQTRDQERSRQAEAWLKSLRETRSEHRGPAPTIVSAGDSAKIDINQPDLEQSRTEKDGVGVGAEDEARDTFSLTSKSPLTLLLWGIGLIVVIAGVSYGIKLLKQSAAARAALEATDAGIARGISTIRDAMSETADVKEMEILKKRETVLLRERERLGTVGLTGKA